MRHRLAALLLPLLFLAGCASSGGNPTPTMAVATPTPTRQLTELNVAMPETVETFHPLLCTQRDMRSLLSLVYESLIQLDEDGLPAGALAASVQQDGSSRIWTVKLRSQASWQTLNRALTADDLIFTLDLIRAIGSDGAYGYVLDYWTDWQKADEQTVTMQSAYPSYGSVMALDFPILPANAGYSTTEVPDQAVGTGAYIMGAYRNGEKLTFSVNTHWWKQLPTIQTVQAHPYADTQSASTSLMLHQLDVVQSDDLVTEQYSYAGDANAHSYVTPYFEFLAFRCAEGPFSELRLRQAVAYALDRKALINTVYMTHATLADAPLLPSVGLYDHQVRLMQDTARARSLIAETDWNPETPLRLLTCENKTEPLREEAADAIARQLEAVGLRVELDVKPWDEYISALQSGDFDMALAGWYLSDVPDMRDFFSQTGEKNPMGFAGSAMDSCLNAMMDAADQSSWVASISAFKNQLLTDMPIVSLYFRNHTLLTSSYVQNVSQVEEDRAFIGIAQWKLSQDFS